MEIIINTQGDAYSNIQELSEALQVTELVFRSRSHILFKPTKRPILEQFITLSQEIKNEIKYCDIYSTIHCQAISRLLLKSRECLLSIPILLGVGLVEDSFALLRRAIEHLLMLVKLLSSGDSSGFFKGKYDVTSFETLVQQFPINIDTVYERVYKVLCEVVHPRSQIHPRTLTESEVYGLPEIYERAKTQYPGQDFDIDDFASKAFDFIKSIFYPFIKVPLYFYRFSIQGYQNKSYANQLFRLIWQTICEKRIYVNTPLNEFNGPNLLRRHRSTFIARGILTESDQPGKKVIEEAERDIRELLSAHEVASLEAFIKAMEESDALKYFEEASDLTTSPGFNLQVQHRV